MTPYTIVNDQDQVLEFKPKAAVDFAAELYRVAALWLTSTRGEILLAQRGLDATNDAGLWGPAVAGTVEEGETYEANIYKEAEEEIGLTGVKFQLGPKLRQRGDRNYFCQWFTATIEPQEIATFKIQKTEVNAIAWMSATDLVTDVKNYPEKYLPGFETILKAFISEKVS